MTVSRESLQELRDHWAVSAISPEEHEGVTDWVNEQLAIRAVGQQIKFSFEENAEIHATLERAAVAYELAAIEGLDELSRPAGDNNALREITVAAAYRAFEIRRLFPMPSDHLNRLYFVLQIAATAYCGDRWTDLRRWFSEVNLNARQLPLVDASWDLRLLYRLYDCWIRLFRKEGWNDIDQIREVISGLRADQKIYEERVLNSHSNSANHTMALRLVALYNWAKATETLATFSLQGEPNDPFGRFDKHFEAAIEASRGSRDAQLEIILRWLHATSRIMVTNSLWWAARTVNSRVSEFVRSLAQREHRPMFELLPPQRAALLEEGLLDQAKTAIVIDMPTSGGKTLLAQFRILQALNQFKSIGGWVVYVVPTRALSAQILRRLRRDFEPIGVRVEQLTSAIEVDAFEENLLADEKQPFDILVSTPEKLSLIIRNKKIERPLSLVVMDEAHNLETESRGMRIELLLATMKRECANANFLLLMPFVEESAAIARWLAQDIDAGHSISLSTTPWKPNERIVGLYSAVQDDSENAGWHLEFETLSTTEKALHLRGVHKVGGVKPINVPKSKVLRKGEQTGFALQTAAISTVMSNRGTSIAVANRIDSVWQMAGEASNVLQDLDPVSEEIRLTQDFLRTEISPDFPLIEMLEKGVGVHHAGLSDDVRGLMEWLAEASHLRVLCATSTISQGIDFPVSSVFLQTRHLRQGNSTVEMEPREFWNLAGRAGRLGQDSVGVVGLCSGSDPTVNKAFLGRATGALVSRLVVLLNELEENGKLAQLSEYLWKEQWEDFRCYIAHLLAEKKNVDAALADSEQLLRQTFGHTTLRNDPTQKGKADALLSATQDYTRKLATMQPGTAELADSTGFSPEGVRAAFKGLNTLERKLLPSDLSPESLFGEGGRMADLFSIMLNVPQISESLKEISGKGEGFKQISEITTDWVNGRSIKDIAQAYFKREKDDEFGTGALTAACRGIYRAIANSATWGVSALSQFSNLDIDNLSDEDKRRINTIPAMIYHGVSTEDAVLMRMNSAPRTISEELGALYREEMSDDENRYSISSARKFLLGLDEVDWEHARPTGTSLSGGDYKRIWEVLSGESE